MAFVAGVSEGQDMPAVPCRDPLSGMAVPRGCISVACVFFRCYAVSHAGAAADRGVCGSACWDAEDGRSARFRASAPEQQLPACVCAAHGTVSGRILVLPHSLQSVAVLRPVHQPDVQDALKVTLEK